MLVYDLFAGDASGGPVDYTAPVVSGVTGLSAALPALAPGTRTRFAVRARDTVTGLVDRNTDAQVLVVVGADGSDQSNAPAPPQALRCLALAGGSARAEWAWPYLVGPFPVGFRVYRWLASGPPDYATPAATVPFAATTARSFAFRSALSGLADGVDYKVAVRAYDATGEEQNAASVSVTGRSSPPGDVASLSATAAY